MTRRCALKLARCGLQGMVSALPAFVRSRSINSASEAASAALDAVLEALADDEVGFKHIAWKASSVQLLVAGIRLAWLCMVHLHPQHMIVSALRGAARL